MNEEIWKDVAGYEGHYKVSSLGNVLSVRTNNLRKFNTVGAGYLQVSLCLDGVKTNFYVHRLVANAFCDNPLSLTQVNHKNGTKADNNNLNLEWCDAQHNKIHSVEVLKVGIGQARSQSKLTDKQVIEIRKLSKQGTSGKHLSKMFSVGATTISDVINFKLWKHLPLEEEEIS